MRLRIGCAKRGIKRVSDSAVFVVLVMAVLIDICGLFPTWIGDRLAFIGYVAVFSAGFTNSGLAGLVNTTISGFFDFVVTIYDAPVTRGAKIMGPQILAGFVLLMVIGAFAPVKWSRLLGTFAHINFSDLRHKRAGTVRTVAAGAEMKGPPAQSFMGGFMKKLFPGTVNIGMVVLAILFVSSNATVGGGVGTAMTNMINASQSIGNSMASVPLSALPKK